MRHFPHYACALAAICATVLMLTNVARAIPGDANGDGTVDGLDYLIIVDELNQTTTGNGNLMADFNADGVVDGLDYLVFVEFFGQSDAPPDADYWVANYGDDNNAGTASAPFRTIQRAAQAAQAGDVVRIAAGVYDGWYAVRSGQPNAPITFIGAGSDTVIDGSGRSGRGFFADGKSDITIESMAFRWWQRDGLFIKDGNAITLDRLNVQGCGWGAGWSKGIFLQRVDGISITNVDSNENYVAGIYMTDCDNAVIDTCVTNSNTGTSGSDGILVQNSRNLLIQDCYASDNREDGIDVGGFEDTTTDSHSVTILRCTATLNGGEGFAVSATNGTLFQTYDVVIADSAAVDNNGDGVEIYQQAFNVTVRNSDLSRNRRGLNINSNAHDIDVVDNIVRDNRAEPWSIDPGCYNVNLTNNDTGGN